MPKANWFWGPLSPLGLGVALLTVLVDQAHKAWMLYVYDIGARGTVTLTPFFDLILVWNRGGSIGTLRTTHLLAWSRSRTRTARPRPRRSIGVMHPPR